MASRRDLNLRLAHMICPTMKESMTRDLGDGRSEIMTLSWWRDLDDIRTFAGDDIAVARYYPQDDGYLLERDDHVTHDEVYEPPSD